MQCKCGSETLFTQTKSPHLGLYCAKCGKWIKWVSLDEHMQLLKSGHIIIKHYESVGNKNG